MARTTGRGYVMRVAAIYDIHGNLPALEAVLDVVHDEGVDQIVVGGDIVPGPMPRACVSALQGLSVPVRFIRGNGERDTLVARRGGELTRVPQSFHEVMHWVAGQLRPQHIRDFAAWPLTLELEIPELGEVLFCHATPRDDNEIFTRATPEPRLWPVFSAVSAAVAVCGHTHMQFDRRVGEVRVVNAGSVGMPFGEPGAYWALIGPRDVELRRTEYDLAAAAMRIQATDYPMDFAVERPASESEMLELFEAAALR